MHNPNPDTTSSDTTVNDIHDSSTCEGELNVINLSSHKLTTTEQEVLSLGLSFCPNRSLDSFETIKDINLFARKLLLNSLYTKKIYSYT